MKNIDPISENIVTSKQGNVSKNNSTPQDRIYLPEIFMYLAEVSRKGIIRDISVIYDEKEISVAIIGVDGFKYWWDNKLSKEDFKSFLKGVIADVVTRYIR